MQYNYDAFFSYRRDPLSDSWSLRLKENLAAAARDSVMVGDRDLVVPLIQEAKLVCREKQDLMDA